MIIVADHPHGPITTIHDYLTMPITKDTTTILPGNMNVREGIVNFRDSEVSSLCYSKQVENTPRKQERWCAISLLPKIMNQNTKKQTGQIQSAVPVQPSSLLQAEPIWMTALKQLRTEGATYSATPLPATVVLPDHLSSRLSKAQLSAFLGLPTNTQELKNQLLQRLLSLIETDQEARTQFFDVFVQELAVEPKELETLLVCSSTERKCWIKDGKLPVLGYRTFHKAGRDLAYPIHDRRVILGLTQAEIGRWRSEHQVLIQLRRKTGAQTAQLSRKVNQQARQDSFSAMEEMVHAWEQASTPQLAAVLKLAFWTQWASRWAKENHVKNQHAIKHHALYQERRNAWYVRKNEAMRVLVQTPYAQLSFYRPEEADKWSLQLCNEHYEMRKEFFYENKWAFFADFAKEIKQCPRCHVSVNKDYYSLYHLQIAAATFPELHFSFHIPYSIGKTFLPSPKGLPRVEHTEQDGMFRFGRL